MIKFGDLAREYAEIQAEIDAAVARVLKRGWFVLGPEVEAFEAAFAGFTGLRHAVACASGTDAIALALMAAGVGPGDEVITVSHTAVPTVTAIEMAGARPVFVDVCRDTMLMDVTQVAAAIGAHTRAILPVHLYGQCVDMDPLLALGLQHAIPIVEDCAQCHGATYRGRQAGSMGLLSAYSFYPSKNLGCYGDGGAVITDDDALAERLRMLRNYGQRQRYHHEIRGINSRLDDLQAAILCTKLPHVGRWNARRQAIAARYSAGLAGLPLERPLPAPYGEHVYHLYPIRAARRDALQSYLAEHGVQTISHYPIPVHLQPAYADLGYAQGSLPATEAAASQVLSLPMYPQLGDDEIDAIIDTVASFFA